MRGRDSLPSPREGEGPPALLLAARTGGGAAAGSQGRRRVGLVEKEGQEAGGDVLLGGAQDCMQLAQPLLLICRFLLFAARGVGPFTC